jgi:hypothetical protein
MFPPEYNVSSEADIQLILTKNNQIHKDIFFQIGFVNKCHLDLRMTDIDFFKSAVISVAPYDKINMIQFSVYLFLFRLVSKTTSCRKATF